MRALLIAACAAVLTAGCAAGEHAQTANIRPGIDATDGQVGDISLDAVALRAPTGPHWAPGASVSLTAHISNNGQQVDRLINVSSPMFNDGWTVVPFSTHVSRTSSRPPPQRIDPGTAIGYGFQNLNPAGAHSGNALYLRGLTTRLYPGSSVKVTFTFVNAGSTTLTVPVQLQGEPGSPPAPYTPTSEPAVD